MFHKLIRGIAPVAALALGAALGGCGDVDIRIDGEEGVPLAELDVSGAAPESLVLAGPDKVVLTDGASLDIDVGGDSKAAELVRFTLKDGTLGVMREKGKWSDVGTAVVTVTMPAPKSITIAGSGSVESQKTANEADLTIAGSGTLSVAEMKATKANVTLAGSGALEAAGEADSLDLNIVGSGKADMAGLQVETADITIAGSGDASFASDGKVEATIMGSGTVRVIGRANCEVNSMGSGRLVCEAPAASDTSAEEDAAAPDQAAADKASAKTASKAKKKLAKTKAAAKKPRKA